MNMIVFVKEGSSLKSLDVPVDVVRDLLRDRLIDLDVTRIKNFAKPVTVDSFPTGSVVIDFSTRTAKSYGAPLRLEYLEPTWDVKSMPITLQNY